MASQEAQDRLERDVSPVGQRDRETVSMHELLQESKRRRWRSGLSCAAGIFSKLRDKMRAQVARTGLSTESRASPYLKSLSILSHSWSFFLRVLRRAVSLA